MVTPQAISGRVTTPAETVDTVKAAARACTVCAPSLPLGPRPVLRGNTPARLLIVGQAPGAKVHASGIPWDDASGARLRQWLALPPEVFYDEDRVAIVPMGLCYPGANPKGGDNPPRPDCAPLWQARMRAALPAVSLTLLIGQYAQGWWLGSRRLPTMTATVARWRDYAPAFFPLPHPSWRNTAWLKKNPWFEAEALPVLRQRVAEAVHSVMTS